MLRRLFGIFDLDGSGEIDVKEFIGRLLGMLIREYWYTAV